MGRAVTVIAACLAFAALTASSAATAAAAPARATVAVTSNRIVSLAAGGGRVAYRTRRVDAAGDVCNGVHVVRLDGAGAATVIGCAPVGHGGPGNGPIVPQNRGTGIVVSARSLAYDFRAVGPLNATHDEAVSELWRVGAHGRTRLAAEDYEITCSGTAVGAFAYGGGVAFTRTVMTEIDPGMECQFGSGGGNGVSSMTAAGLRYVPTGAASAVTIPAAPGAARLAARWPVLALVPLALPQAMGLRDSPPHGATASVESWNLRTQTRTCTASLPGVPAAVATNGTQIALLVPAPQGVRLVRLSAGSCGVVGSRALQGRVPARLAMGAHVVAWVSGRSVVVMHLATGRVSRVYRAALAPHGLALTGGRLVWWVNGRHGSRVLRMPPS